jgi:hypothetical protein
VAHVRIVLARQLMQNKNCRLLCDSARPRDLINNRYASVS